MGQIKLPKNPGDTGWKEILPKRKVNSKLSDHINADYLIIGGGFAGLSAARRLNQIDNKAKIALLEACEIAEGPAGRNSGFMIDLPHNLASDDYVGSLDRDRHQKTNPLPRSNDRCAHQIAYALPGRLHRTRPCVPACEPTS